MGGMRLAARWPPWFGDLSVLNRGAWANSLSQRVDHAAPPHPTCEKHCSASPRLFMRWYSCPMPISGACSPGNRRCAVRYAAMACTRKRGAGGERCISDGQCAQPGIPSFPNGKSETF